ncbi:unnamed protein product [Prunus brigantina]
MVVMSLWVKEQKGKGGGRGLALWQNRSLKVADQAQMVGVAAGEMGWLTRWGCGDF